MNKLGKKIISGLHKARLWLNDPARTFAIHKLAIALYLPIFLIAVYGKIERKRFDGEASVDTILLLAPEFIFYSLLTMLHIIIFRALKDRGNKISSALAAAAIGLLWLNFLSVEILGNVYGITTSNSDFDYSLILHSLSHLDGLFAVFMSVIEPTIALSSIILLILYPLYLVHLVRSYATCSIKTTVGDRQALKTLSLMSILPAIYLATVGAGRMTDVPLPIALSAIDRSINTKIDKMGALEHAPVRQRYALDAKLEKINSDASPPNLVVIILESTRYQSTLGSTLGEKVTPYMHALKDKAITYSSAYAVVPHTSKSIESIYCSVEPKQGLALVSANPIVGIPSRCMAGFLDDLGYNNIFISPAPATFEDRATFLANAGFDDAILGEDMDTKGYETVNYFGYEDKIMLPYAKQWLESKGDEPFFMSLLTITPHHDYILPSGYKLEQFTADPTLNNYLNTLKYQDGFLKDLMAIFKESGHLDNTLFVVVGDHGEAFGEHGNLMHDTVMNDEGTRVPLLFYGAGIDQASTISTPVSLLDIMPTAFAKMGLAITPNATKIFGGTDAQTRATDRPVFSYCYREQLCSAVVKGDWKFIYHHGYSKNELFHLKDDAGELTNLVDQQPERAQSMEKELTDWLAAVRSYNQRYFNFKTGRN